MIKHDALNLHDKLISPLIKTLLVKLTHLNSPSEMLSY